MDCQNLNSKPTLGKRRRSDSCRSSSLEISRARKIPRVDYARFSRERFLKRKKAQTLFSTKKRKNLPNGQSFKFFYGGSIEDPLNLNGLINRGEMSSCITPIASPMITPLRSDVLLPIFRCANIHDPLNLCGECPDDCLTKPKQKRKRRYSYKKHNKSKELNCEEKPEVPSVDLSTKPEEVDNEKNDMTSSFGSNDREKNNECKVPRPLQTGLSSSTSKESTKEITSRSPKAKTKNKQPVNIKHKEKNTLFRFGNCSSYVGYCNLNNYDARVDLLAGETLQNESVLDIGCNVGNVTIKIAKELSPKKVVGIDIDPHLIKVARKNLSFFSNSQISDQQQYPTSMKSLYGPLFSHPLMKVDDKSLMDKFPLNIEFRTENYVPLSEYEAKEQKAKYDVIVAFGVTKYIHLNYGDEGLKRAFIKMFNHLKPGGKLFLQAQHWSSYKGKKKLSEEIFNTYKGMQFFPSQFKEFLLSPSVGFSECYHVADIQLYNQPRGVHQSILKFVKSIENKCDHGGNNERNNLHRSFTV